jgi:hypothetical protein
MLCTQTVKVEAMCSPDILVTIYRTDRRHILEDNSLNIKIALQKYGEKI